MVFYGILIPWTFYGKRIGKNNIKKYPLTRTVLVIDVNLVLTLFVLLDSSARARPVQTFLSDRFQGAYNIDLRIH